MDMDTLKHNLELHRQLDMAYEMAQSIRDRGGLRAASLSAMPRGSDVADRVGEIAIAAADLDARIKDLEDQVEAGDQAVRAFANQAGDVRVQQIILLRFVACLTWEQVAAMLGERYDASRCRRILSRYMEERARPDQS